MKTPKKSGYIIYCRVIQNSELELQIERIHNP